MPHVYVGPHPNILGNGTPLALDQIIHNVDVEDVHNRTLIARGWLIEHNPPAPSVKAPRGEKEAN
jgi:hypothetical protein